MPKGGTAETRSKNTITALREQLHALDVGAANLERMKPEEVVALLKDRDEMEGELVRLEALGLDLRSERGQAQAVDGRLYKKTGCVGRALRKFGGFSGMREKLDPPEEHWWWYLDVYRRNRIKRDLRKGLITVAAIVLVVILGNFVADKLWGMPPDQKEAYTYKSNGDLHMVQGEYEAALEDFEASVEVYTGDPEVYTSLAVLYELEGREDASKEAMVQAEQLLEDRSEYLTLLGQAYITAGLLDKGVDYTTQAIENDPEYAYAYYVRSTAYEITADYAPAISDLNMVTELADEQGLDELYVLAKQRIGVMYQGGAGGF